MADDERTLEDVIQRMEKRYLEATLDDLTLQPPSGPEIGQLMDDVRAAAKTFATKICEAVPDSIERDNAITKLRETLFWAVGGIAVHQDEAKIKAALRAKASKVPAEDRCTATALSSDAVGVAEFGCDLPEGHEGQHQHQHGYEQYGRLDTW